jgi:hypothetical protein
MVVFIRFPITASKDDDEHEGVCGDRDLQRRQVGDPLLSSLRKPTVPLYTPARIAAGYPDVEIVSTGKNHGFGKANNIGMERAYQRCADCVFLLNQDAWIDPDAVTKLVEAHARHPACGIISPMHLNGAGDGLDYGFSNYIAPHKCRGLYSDLFLGRVRELYEVGFVNAAAWLVTRECVERVGGFSPSFFHYGEDDNYTQRLQFHKLKRLLHGIDKPAILANRERSEAGRATFPDLDGGAVQPAPLPPAGLHRRIRTRVKNHMGKRHVLPGKNGITASYECSITRITTVRAIQIR